MPEIEFTIDATTGKLDDARQGRRRPGLRGRGEAGQRAARRPGERAEHGRVLRPSPGCSGRSGRSTGSDPDGARDLIARRWTDDRRPAGRGAGSSAASTSAMRWKRLVGPVPDDRVRGAGRRATAPAGLGRRAGRRRLRPDRRLLAREPDRGTWATKQSSSSRAAPIRCRGCITPDTWDSNGGVHGPGGPARRLRCSTRSHERDGVTILGGEPFAQPDGLLALVAGAPVARLSTTSSATAATPTRRSAAEPNGSRPSVPCSTRSTCSSTGRTWRPLPTAPARGRAAPTSAC